LCPCGLSLLPENEPFSNECHRESGLVGGEEWGSEKKWEGFEPKRDSAFNVAFHPKNLVTGRRG